MKKLHVSQEDVARFTHLVRKTGLFARMNMGLMEKILAHVAIYEYSKGEKICKQGGPGDSFYVVYSGRLGVSVRKGRLSFSKQVADLAAGDCFGEMALLNRASRTATVETLEDSKVFVLLADHFEAAIADNTEFKNEIKALAAERKFELDNK
ncbi:MAG: cyclic nucleotide-binding domain-containing protein [Desulfobacteraceae bacterium]|nr:MAG: cyclic nucleotide-binding domain-containing protein [Desulfobacteraceae bacterium]